MIYKGTFKEVVDDDDHRIRRGERVAVCDKTFRLYSQEPYRGSFELIEPRREVSLTEATSFDCSRDSKRHPRETKGRDFNVTTEPGVPCCGPDECC